MDPLAQLFLRFRARGDLRALGKVFDELAPRLLPIALHLCGNPGDAEDALQQTFVLAIERADAFDATRRLEPWLAGLLTNVARNARRDAQRRRAEAMPDIAAADAGPAELAERREIVAFLRTQVGALPHEQRQVLLLQMQHGMTPAEIAEVLAVPAGTVRMRIHRGLQALKKLLPAGLGALLFGGLTARGLAAVRTAVLRAGAARAATTAAATTAATSTVLGGLVAMKKILAAFAVLLCCGILWWTLASPTATSPAADPAHGVATPAIADVRGETTAGRERADAADAEPAQRSVTTGALRIRTLAAEGDTDLPLPGMLVVVWSGDNALEPFDDSALRLRTDDRGEIALPTLLPGDWQVLVPADREEPRAATVTAGTEALVEFRQPARAVVRGIVVDPDGQPIADADLWVLRGTYMAQYSLPESDEIASRRAGSSGPDGRFTVATVDLREGRLTASHAGYGESFGRYVSSVRGEIRLVLLRGEARVSGTVRDSNGTPVAGALVTATSGGNDSRRAPDGTLFAGRVPRHLRSDADGRFRFVGMAPGTVHLGASAYPRNSAEREVEVVGGAQAEVDLELPDGVTVIGTVRLADGTPARAGVTSRPSRDTNGHFSQCDVRPDGTFLLQYQPRRSFFVVAGLGGVDVATRAVVDPQPGVLRCDLVIDDAALVRGRVVDATDQPLVGWLVTADLGDKSVWMHTGRGGSFCLALPTAGEATLTARAVGARTAAVSRGIHAGQTVELRVPGAAVPSAMVRGRLTASDGTPAAACRLELRCADPRVTRNTTTAADGTFAFAGLVPSQVRLVYEHGGNATPLGAPSELADGEQRDLGDVVLPPVATLVADLVDGNGRPWTAELVGLELRDAAGKAVDVDHSTAGGRLRVAAPPGSYRVSINATDLIAAPQQVTLTAGQETTVRIALTVARTRTVTFNGDGREKPDDKTALHVTIRRGDSTIELQRDVTNLLPNLKGFRYWYVNHVFAFGRYDVEAHTDGGWHYRGSLDVTEDLEAPTTVDIPRAQ